MKPITGPPPRFRKVVLAVVILVVSAPAWTSALRVNALNVALLRTAPPAGTTINVPCTDRATGGVSSTSGELPESSTRVLLSASRAAAARGACVEALRLLAGLQDVEAARLRAVLCLRLEEYQCAEAALSQAGSRYLIADWLASLADARARSNQSAVSAEIFELAETFAPLQPKWLIAYASVLAAEGRQDEQVAVLREAAQREPDSPEVRHRLGRALWEREPGSVEAIDELETAVALRTYAPYNFQLGLAYEQVGRLDEARAQYLQVLPSGIGRFDVLTHLGDVALAQGHLAEAADRYHQALTLAQSQDVETKLALACASLRRPELTSELDGPPPGVARLGEQASSTCGDR